jgi:phage major head subunit gpT-like protein
MSGFTRLPGMFGAEAAAKENELAYKVLTANANMADGNALFSTAHGNLATGGGSALTNDAAGLAALGALQNKLRQQKAPAVGGDAGRVMNLTGRTMVLPSALEYIANALFSQSVVPATTAAANPYRGTFGLVVEPLLDASSTASWYLMADPARVDTVHYGYLEGETGPVIMSEVDFDTDGMKMKCTHNFAAAAIDHRGMCKSAGS